MKIKCPACQAVLEVPDSAAGKVVKCSCGKQMRAPGGAASAPAAAPPTPSAPQPSAPRPSAPRPQPSAPSPTAGGAAAGGGYVSPFLSPPTQQSGGILDELTDSDLAPVKAVAQPGAKPQVKPHGATAEKMLREASGNTDRRAEGLLATGEAPRPGLLIFIGVVNAFWGLVCVALFLLFVGLVGMVDALAGEVPDAGDGTGLVFYLLAALMAVLAVISFATCVACFTRGAISWYIVLFSYGWGVADRVFKVVDGVIENGVDAKMIGAGIGVLIGVAFWAWLHGEDVRDYYGTNAEPKWKIITVDVIGFVAAAILWGIVFVMTGE